MFDKIEFILVNDDFIYSILIYRITVNCNHSLHGTFANYELIGNRN